MEKRLAELIRKRDNISEQKLNSALKEQERTDESLVEVLVRMGLLIREVATKRWAEAGGYPYLDLYREECDPQAIKLVNRNLAERFQLVPFKLENGTIKVCMSDPSNVMAIDSLRRSTNKRIEVYLSDKEVINKTIYAFYGETTSIDEYIEKNISYALEGDAGFESSEPPVVRIVDLLIEKAVLVRATDMHVTPEDKSIRISYRIDGIMRPDYVLPKKLHRQLVSRIKIMSRINIAEQRIPLDGNITYEYSGRYIDIRVSTSPTAEGENIVLRLLDKANIVVGISNLGLGQKYYDDIYELSMKPHGIVLSAGPTGSGKTTTLYSILQELDALQRNVLTIEDPIEYRLSYIKQSQVNEKAGLKFSTAIRHFLRQDPDVILVGEIRDLETAQVAFQAAMTGHLVLSTIHTNDAASCIARLMDLGIETYLIPSSLRAVIAQRLVRKVCTNCMEDHILTDDEIKRYSLGPDDPHVEKRGIGCFHCEGTGYIGRVGIFEILHMSNSISPLILQKVSADQIVEQAKEEGMKSMREDGIDKVRNGITTFSEVYRVTG